MSKLINLSSRVLDEYNEDRTDMGYLLMISDLGDLCYGIIEPDTANEMICRLTKTVLRYANASKININLDIKDEVKPVKNTDLELIKMIIDCISENSFKQILIPINALAEKRGTNIIRLLNEEYSN